MSLPITDPLIVDVGRRLSDGGHHYGEQQLYYAVCAEVEEPPKSVGRGLIGCGVLVMLMAALLLRVHTLPLTPLVGGLGLIIAGVGGLSLHWDRQNRAVPRSRLLPLGFTEFRERHLTPLLERRTGALPGLVSDSPPALPSRLARDAVLLVSDRPDTVAVLSANAGFMPAGTIPCTEDALGRRLRGRRVVAVHDADPRGCELTSRLGDAGATHVIDAGLRPPQHDVGLQIIEGAPARLPRDLSGVYSVQEIDWLRSGRRLEIASLDPAALCALVNEALAPLR